MASADKDTVYIDIDDEITGVIDKVQASKHKIVALVLPKRATVFQSIVNMKLLKRSADDAKKHVVLVTSEAGLLPLAGAVGLRVAKTLQSKPEVPLAPEADEVSDAAEDAIPLDNAADGDFDPEANAKKPVGDLVSADPAPTKPLAGVETLELDNNILDEAGDKAGKVATPSAKKAKNKKLKVPNFNKFRLRIALAVVVLLALIGLWFVAYKVLPRATIEVKTDAQAINSSLELTLDSSADTLQPDQRVVPADREQEQKTATEQVPATGQKNKGNKASGSVTMSAQKCSGNPFDVPGSVPAGTGVSVNGQTFITQQTTSFHGSGLSGSCFTYEADNDTPVVAQSPGASYNTNNASFSVAGRSDVSANGSTSGGSDNIVKVVQQSDINAAKQKLEKQNADDVKKTLEQRLKQSNLFAIPATFSTGTPNVTTSANVGDTADNVTVTENITYTMYGAKESDLKQLIERDVKGQIDDAKQAIIDDGLTDAVFKVIDTGDNSVQVSLDVTATAGPDLNTDELKKQIAGKKSGEVKTIIKQNPGVTSVEVHYSPFWVSSAPNNSDKITITFAKPKAPASSNNGSSTE